MNIYEAAQVAKGGQRVWHDGQVAIWCEGCGGLEWEQMQHTLVQITRRILEGWYTEPSGAIVVTVNGKQVWSSEDQR